MTKMTARESLRSDIMGALIKTGALSDEVRQLIDIALDGYEVAVRCTEVAVQESTDDEMVRRFMIDKAVAGCARSSVEQYIMSLRKLVRETGKHLDEVTDAEVRYYLAIRKTRDHVSDATLSNERRNISAFYAWAETMDIMKNPVRKVPPIKKIKKLKKAFTELEIEKLRHACTCPKERAAIELLLSTGCRVSEVLQIQLQEVRGGKVAIRGKGNKYRTVYLNAKAQLALEEVRKTRQDDNPYLFTGRDGMITVDGFRAILKRIADRAGVQGVHPHRFRRTCATFALRRGMPIEQVSRMLGHDKIATTQIYLDLDDSDLEYYHSKYVA